MEMEKCYILNLHYATFFLKVPHIKIIIMCMYVHVYMYM